MKTKQIIDAVTVGINALALALPPHYTFKYYNPLGLSGPSGAAVPALAVAPVEVVPELLDTAEGYEYNHRLRATWYADQMNAMSAGKADETKASLAMDHSALIVGVIVSWADAVPGLAFQSEATLGTVRYGHIEGGIYAVEHDFTVTTWEM